MAPVPAAGAAEPQANAQGGRNNPRDDHGSIGSERHVADQKPPSHAWECFTCGGCGKAVLRRRTPNPTPRRCLCCSFLDTVQDARMREALRTVLEPGGGPVAEPRPDGRPGNQADDPGDASQPFP